MIYILAGSARSGKSILARKLLKEKNVPYFNTDILTFALEQGAPELHVGFKMHAMERAEPMWPLLKPIIDKTIEYVPHYVIEGDSFLPKLLHEVQAQHPDEVKVVFTGFTRMSSEEKLDNIRKYMMSKDNWTHEFSNEELLPFIQSMVDFSKYLEEECRQYSLPYFDTSENFLESVDQVYQYLVG